MTGGDAVIHALEKEGVEFITGFAGGGELPLWPALRASTSIKIFATRHERQGVEIADGYARATGKVGVALTGTGPGATNTLTGIAGAFADNIYKWTDAEGNVHYGDRPSGAETEIRMNLTYNRTDNDAVEQRIPRG